MRGRGVQDGEPRQQAELDRLMHQRIGAGDHRLAGDHRRRGGEHDHRHQEGFGHQPVERILDRRRIGQHLGALAEIIDQQRRQHQAQPGGLDRLAAEMAEIGIERLAAGHHQEHGAERDQADGAMRRAGIRRRTNGLMATSTCGSSLICRMPAIAIETNQTTMIGPNKAATLAVPRLCAANSAIRMTTVSGATIFAEGGAGELQAFHRRQHRNRRRDHAVAEEHRGANDADDEDVSGAAAERAARQRRERERAALPVIVGAQQHQHVFGRDDNDQRPENERQHAEHDARAKPGGFRSPRWPPRGRRRAGWCRCRHRPRRRCPAPRPQNSAASRFARWRRRLRWRPDPRSLHHSSRLLRILARAPEGAAYNTAKVARTPKDFPGRRPGSSHPRAIIGVLGGEIRG